MSSGASKKGKITKIVLACVFGPILLFIIVVEGILLVQKYVKKSPVPMVFGYASMKVATGSMNGTIDEGDVIIIKKTNEYALGDIVTYIEGGATPVTHRLVNYGPEEGTFIAKGDANKSADRFPVSEDQIAGEVVLVIPKLGIVFDWFLSGFGFVYVIAIIVVIVGAVYIIRRLKPAPAQADEQTNTPEEGVQQKEDVQPKEGNRREEK